MLNDGQVHLGFGQQLINMRNYFTTSFFTKQIQIDKSVMGLNATKCLDKDYEEYQVLCHVESKNYEVFQK